MEYIRNDGYYHFCDDLSLYPDAWCYIIWSSRGQGKTYSALKYAYCNHIPIAYLKRTKADIRLICNENNIGFDASPYVPINRDCGTDIRAKMIDNDGGIGGFYDGDADDKNRLPIAYCAALSAAKSLKGFDFSRCDWMVLDEFIPQAGEIVRHAEGEMILDLYMTIRRDREARGRAPLKLILFANAEEIVTPITSTLEVVDNMADLNASGEEYAYNETRGILLHKVKTITPEKDRGTIYAAMRDTAWGRKAFGGEFANNDFTRVKKMSLKGLRPVCGMIYKRHYYYVYQRHADGLYYMCASRANVPEIYDLDVETDRARFGLEWGSELIMACIDGLMYFQTYTMYDLIYNFNRRFRK